MYTLEHTPVCRFSAFLSTPLACMPRTPDASHVFLWGRSITVTTNPTRGGGTHSVPVGPERCYNQPHTWQRNALFSCGAGAMLQPTPHVAEERTLLTLWTHSHGRHDVHARVRRQAGSVVTRGRGTHTGVNSMTARHAHSHYRHDLHKRVRRQAGCVISGGCLHSDAPSVRQTKKSQNVQSLFFFGLSN